MPYRDLAVQRAYQRKWMAERRAEALAGKSCAFCAGGDRLEFHHFDQHAKVDHKVWSWTKARRERELAKCVVLCHDCHVTHHRANGRRFCKRGHEFTPANTYIKPSRGTRECLTCKRSRARGVTLEDVAA